MRRFWAAFFMVWPVLAIISFAIAPWMNWWFPGPSATPLGVQIDNLFYLILVIVAVTFVATQMAIGYVLWRGARHAGEKAWYTHGSHNLEVIWTIVPAIILMFISLYQLDVWAHYRVKSHFPDEAVQHPIAEVTARQFEWRIRYPSPDRKFTDAHGKFDQRLVDAWLKQPEPDDLYTVNDLHVPSGRPVLIHLRSADVQHAFFAPELRVKQDAVPNLIIPIWFHVTRGDKYELVCAELCGWGHYKMKAQVWAQPIEDFHAYLRQLKTEQSDDGYLEKESDESE